jgi:PD-(D/E)XK nuclease superfamily
LSGPSIQTLLGRQLSHENLTTLCKLAAAVIEKMKKARVARFDPFILCYTDPPERSLNKVIWRLLDPEEIHGLGLAPIRGLLCAAKPYAPKKVQKILDCISKNSQVRVRHDYGGGGNKFGLVDIALYGAGFIIFIENKKRWGSETENQVKGYAELLEREACLSPVQPCETLGISLSPDGKVPSHESFVRLLSSEFADAVCEAIKECQNAPDESRLLVRAFLVSYKWFS